MAWWSVLPVAVVLLLVLAAPGAVVLAAAGVPLRDSVALAPAVSVGVVAVAAPLSTATGMPWGALPVGVVTALAAVVAGLAAGRLTRTGLLRDRAPVRRSTRSRRRAATATAVLVCAVVTGAALQLVPLAVGMGRPDRVQNAWDALFHLSGVQLLRRAGTADPRILSELAAPGEGTTYPYAWHALTALVPQTADGALVAVSTAAFLPATLVAVAGVAALTHAVLPHARHAPAVAALLTSGGVAMPLAVAVQPGLIPNALGLALVPGVLASLVRPPVTWRAAVVPITLAAAGVGTSHPGAFLGLLLLGSPWLALMAWRWVARDGVRSPCGQRRLLGLSSVVLVGAVALALNPTAQVVAGVMNESSVEPVELARRLVTGDLGEWSVRPLATVALAVLGSAVLLTRRRGRALVVAAAAATLAYAAASSPVDLVSYLTGLWYSEPRRLAPLVGIATVPLAAHGLVVLGSLARRLAARAAARVGGPTAVLPATAAGVLVAGLLVVAVAPGPPATRALADDAFTQVVPDRPEPMDRVPYLTVEEERMVDRLRAELDPTALLLGSSFSGPGHLAALTGQRVVQPYHTHELDDDARLISVDAADLGVDPELCAAVRRAGARYLWVDPYPLHSTYWSTTYPASFRREPGPAARLLDSAGATSVYALDGCYPD